MEESKIISCSWILPGEIRKTFAFEGSLWELFCMKHETCCDWTAWKIRCSLCWSYCEKSSASLAMITGKGRLLQKLKWFSWHSVTCLERTGIDQTEGLNPHFSQHPLDAVNIHYMCKNEEGKFGFNFFKKKKKKFKSCSIYGIDYFGHLIPQQNQGYKY